MKKLYLFLTILTLLIASKVFADIEVTGKFAPKNDGFVGLVDGDQVIINQATYSVIDSADTLLFLDATDSLVKQTLVSDLPSGAPTDADYLVGTSNASLSAEIVAGTSPGGELGGTWASPTVDSGIHDDEYIELEDNFVGDVTGPYNATVVGDDSHNHTGPGLSGIDISDSTNLIAGTNITLSDDTLNVDDAFVVNSGNDIMTGTLTADGLTLGQDENITLGIQTIDHNGTDFVFNDSITIGDNSATNFSLSFDAFSNNGIITWDNTLDRFSYDDDIIMNASENVYFRDSVLKINSSVDGQLDIDADVEVEITTTTLDINGAVDISGTTTLNTLSGSIDAGAATSLEIPNGTNPTTDADGEIAFDTNAEAIEIYDGTTSRLIVSLKEKDKLIFAPDFINDKIPIFHVDADIYPHGIKLVNVQITIPSDAAYSMVFEEWAGDPPVAQNDIETVSTGATDSYMEVLTTNIDDSDIDADDYIFLDVPSTNVDWILCKVIYYVKEGN